MVVGHIFVVAKRYNSISSAMTTKHGNHGLVEVTFTLNRHDGDIICISGIDGGSEGRFSYVDMMYQTGHADAKNEEEKRMRRTRNLSIRICDEWEKG
jgi:hypothetical protein